MVNIKNFFRFKEPVRVEDLHPKEIGAVGTKNNSGYYDEEYLQKLRDLDGIDAYDEMRRSDAQVKMLLSVVKNPILSASWGVESVDDSPEEKEIAAFAEHILFNDIGYVDGSKEKTFRQFVREALLMLDYGHSVFEIVHKNVMNHPRFGNYTGLSDLSWRNPKTIYEWHLLRNGGLSHIRQITQTDPVVDTDIPAAFLLVLTNDLEGSNYQGISALRSIYGNFFRKNLYRKFQAVGIERGSSGVPMGEIDDAMRTGGEFEKQWAAFKTMLKNFASNQQNYIALEKGFKVSELKLSHDPEKVQRAIDGENVEMTKSFLANFMELGLGGSGGSYSLGSDLSDIFLSSISTIADEVAECLDRKVTRKLIRAKYGDREFYPKVRVTGINDKAGKELAEVVKILSDAGAIKPDDRLQAHLHKLYKFPQVERQQEEDSASEDDPNPPANGDSKDKTPAPVEQEDAELSASPASILLAEKKNNEIADFIDKKSEGLAKVIRDSLTLSASKFRVDIQSGLEDKKSRSDIISIKMEGREKYAKALETALVDISDEALKQVAKETGIKNSKLSSLNDLPKRTKERLLAQIALLVASDFDEIEKISYFFLNRSLDFDRDIDETMDELARIHEEELAKPKYDIEAINAASSAVNSARNDYFQSPEVLDEIESFVFVNPDPKSPICKHLAGRVFTRKEYEESPYLPPLHHNCKSTIRAQTKGDSDNLPLSKEGLSIVAEGDEQEKILKSKQFMECQNHD